MYGYLLGRDESKAQWGIEERYVDASLIFAVGKRIAVAHLLSEGGAMDQVAEHGGILYLCEGDQVWEGPFTHCTDDLGDVLYLLLVARVCPAVCTRGKKAVIIVVGIIFGVEEVLHIVAHHTEHLPLPP
jgi:hypothetical protein